MTMPLDVKLFLNACDQKPTDENIDLYYELIKEEYKEFLDAVEDGNNVEQLDACMDMIWVILGYCHMKGFDIKGAWQEVADSNLSKIDKDTGKVLRREDGKILKPEGWKPPKLDRYV
jgi:predicted HAD superfamily Cof-like phosphohydrolase